MKKELKDAWVECKRLRNKGYTIVNKGERLNKELYKTENWESDKLWKKGDRLRIEGNDLVLEGKEIFYKAVKKEYGDIAIEWKAWDHCVLENGVEFK